MDDTSAMLLITMILTCNFCGHSRRLAMKDAYAQSDHAISYVYILLC